MSYISLNISHVLYYRYDVQLMNSCVVGFRNFILQAMDKIRWSRCINYYTNEGIGISNLRDTAESWSVSWCFSWFNYRRKRSEIWKETYGSMQYNYMHTRTFAPSYGWKSIIWLCKSAGNYVLNNVWVFLIKDQVCF